jgi:hypothetical protein
MASPARKDDKTAPSTNLEPSHSRIDDVDDVPSLRKGDLLDLESVDPILNAKMRLVNDAIDEIGFTGYQAKLFVLNGFGYVWCCSFVNGEKRWYCWRRSMKKSTWWFWMWLADLVAWARNLSDFLFMHSNVAANSSIKPRPPLCQPVILRG